jgi:hypothetical protein
VVRRKGKRTGGDRYEVIVSGWSNRRRVIERDGLVCFQVMVHKYGCYTCSERVLFVQEQLDDQNVQYFWTDEDGLMYVTVGPPPPELLGHPGLSPEWYLSFLLGLVIYRPNQSPTEQRQTKARSRKPRKDLQ